MATPNTNDEMRQAAEYAINIAKERFGIQLDYTESSLPALENLIEQAHQQFNSNQTEGKNINETALNRTASVWGSYLGELIRRKSGGTWIIEESKRLIEINGFKFSSIDYVHQRITGQLQGNVKQYFDEVTTKLSAQPKTNLTDANITNQSKSNKASKKTFGKAIILLMILAVLAVVGIAVFAVSIVIENQKASQQYALFLTSPPTMTYATFPTTTPTIILSDTPAETLTPTQDIEKQQLINEVIALFQIGTPDAYKNAYDNYLRLARAANSKYWNDEEIQTLADFALAMSHVAAGGHYDDDFAGISPDYNGVYHTEISSEILKNITREEWTRRYEEEKPIMATSMAGIRATMQLPLPTIGMTAQQVLDSQWGQPIKINKTITAISVSEQWVYGDGKYIYLENGIVVSIQE